MNEVEQVYIRSKSIEALGSDPAALKAVKWDEVENRTTETGGTEVIGVDKTTGTSAVIERQEAEQVPSVVQEVEDGVSFDVQVFPDGRKVLLGRSGAPRKGVGIVIADPEAQKQAAGTGGTKEGAGTGAPAAAAPAGEAAPSTLETRLNAPFAGFTRGAINLVGNVARTAASALGADETAGSIRTGLEAINRMAEEAAGDDTATAVMSEGGNIAGQFIAPAGGAISFLRAAGASPVLATLLADGFVGFAGTAPEEGNLASLIPEDSEAFGALREVMATDPEDPEYQNRLRNLAETVAVLGGAEGAIRGLPKLIDQAKRVEKELALGTAAAVAGTPEDAEGSALSRLVGAALRGVDEAAGAAKKVTDTPAFRRWFGDSKVVDENGEPMVVYHGTRFGDFGDDEFAFDPGKRGLATGAPSAREGFFFAGDPATSRAYVDTSLAEAAQEAAGGGLRSLEQTIMGLGKRLDEVSEGAGEELLGDNVFVFQDGRIILEDQFDLSNPDEVFAAISHIDEISRTIDFKGDDIIEAHPEAAASIKAALDEIEEVKARLEEIDVTDTEVSEGSQVGEFYLSLQKPLVVDQQGKRYRDETYRDIISRAQKQGHDGVIIRNTFDGGPQDDIFIAFDPTQIKSATGNRGTFDPTDPRITAGVAAAPVAAAGSEEAEAAPGETQVASASGRILRMLGGRAGREAAENPPAPRPVTPTAEEQAITDLYSAYRTDAVDVQGLDFNMDNLDTGDEVKEVIDTFSNLYADKIKSRTKGVIPHDVTRQVADLIGGDEEMVKRAVSSLPADTEDLHVRALAMRDLLVKSAERVDQLANRVANMPSQVTDEDLLDFRRAIEQHSVLQANMKGVQTEIARALSAFRIPADSGALARAQVVQEALHASGGRGTVMELARKWIETPVEKRAAFATQSVLARTVGAVREYWINGLLSGVRTHEVNLFSNFLFAAWQVPERALAGAIGGTGNLARRAVGMDRAEQAYMTEAPALLLGWVESVPEATRAAWTTFRTETPLDSLAKIESSEYKAITAQKFGLDEASMAGRFVDIVGVGVRLPGRFLMSADEFNKAIGRRMELRAQAYRLSQAELDAGGTLEDAARTYADVLSGTNEAAKQSAQDFATTVTFTKQLGEGGQALQNMARKVPGAWLILPFIRTPTNIVKEFVARTPAAPLLREVRQDLLAGGARRDLALAKISMGTASMAWASHLSGQGVITGGGPQDPRMRAVWRQKFQPYSINLKKMLGEETFNRLGLENEWLPYGRLEPLGMLFGVAADFAEYRKWAPRDLAEESESTLVAQALGAVMLRVGEKTYMQGMADFAQTFDDPERYAERYFSRLAGTMVPFSSMTKDIKSALDPFYRDTRTDPYENNPMAAQWQASLNEIKGRTPGFSTDLPPRLNFWGEPIRAYEGDWVQAFNAFAPKSDKSQPIDSELIRLRYPLGMPSKQANGVKLNAERYATLVQAMNEIKVPTPAGEKNMRDYFNWLIRTATYKAQLSDEMRIEMLKAARNEFTDMARKAMITPGSKYFDDELFAWTIRAKTQRPLGIPFQP